jgi:hypothetical protein
LKSRHVQDKETGSKGLKDITSDLSRGNWGTALETVGDVSGEACFFDRLQEGCSSHIALHVAHYLRPDSMDNPFIDLENSGCIEVAPFVEDS